MSVCATQDDFNVAVDKAVKYVIHKQETRKLTAAQMISALIYLLIVIWALLLALSMPSSERVEHVLFALLFAPVYIMAYYLGNMPQK